MLADRHTHRRKDTDRQTDRNTPLLYRGGVIKLIYTREHEHETSVKIIIDEEGIHRHQTLPRYRNAARGRPSHDHRGSAHKIS